MFCSEFAWSLLALGLRSRLLPRRQRPQRPASCSRSWADACRRHVVARRYRRGYAGHADGPLLVIDAMKLPEAERNSWCIWCSPAVGRPRPAIGRASADRTDMKSNSHRWRRYYLGMLAEKRGTKERASSPTRRQGDVPDNCSPASFPHDSCYPPHSRSHDGLRRHGRSRVSVSHREAQRFAAWLRGRDRWIVLVPQHGHRVAFGFALPATAADPIFIANERSFFAVPTALPWSSVRKLPVLSRPCFLPASLGKLVSTCTPITSVQVFGVLCATRHLPRCSGPYPATPAPIITAHAYPSPQGRDVQFPRR